MQGRATPALASAIAAIWSTHVPFRRSPSTPPPAGVYALTAPPAVQPLYALGMALLYTLLVAFTRTWLLERRYRVGC